MALNDTKLDSNGVQIAIVYFRKSIKIARQLLAPLPDPVYDVHELKTPMLSTAPKSATFLGITWSLGLSSPNGLNKILAAHRQWTLEIVIFILFTKPKWWFDDETKMMKPYLFYKQAAVKLFVMVFSSNEDGKRIFTINQWRYGFTS